jgi:hypothetical protein
VVTVAVAAGVVAVVAAVDTVVAVEVGNYSFFILPSLSSTPVDIRLTIFHS